MVVVVVVVMVVVVVAVAVVVVETSVHLVTIHMLQPRVSTQISLPILKVAFTYYKQLITSKADNVFHKSSTHGCLTAALPHLSLP